LAELQAAIRTKIATIKASGKVRKTVFFRESVIISSRFATEIRVLLVDLFVLENYLDIFLAIFITAGGDWLPSGFPIVEKKCLFCFLFGWLAQDLLHLLFIHSDCDLIKIRRCHPRPRTWLFAAGTENEDQ